MRLEHQAHQLVGQRQDAEHQVAVDLAMPAYPHIPSAELVFESSIDPLHRRALKRLLSGVTCPMLRCARASRFSSSATRVDINDRQCPSDLLLGFP